jgi:hypothetical protein
MREANPEISLPLMLSKSAVKTRKFVVKIAIRVVNPGPWPA